MLPRRVSVPTNVGGCGRDESTRACESLHELEFDERIPLRSFHDSSSGIQRAEAGIAVGDEALKDAMTGDERICDNRMCNFAPHE